MAPRRHAFLSRRSRYSIRCHGDRWQRRSSIYQDSAAAKGHARPCAVRREAAAYETLAGLGPPRLIEHNADSWNDGNTPLYMALEYIEGLDLQTLVEDVVRSG